MFKLNVYLPNKVILKDYEVSELKIPTVKGEINVLPEHTHVMTNLDIGVLNLTSKGDIKKIGIAFGVCKVLKNEVTILTQVAEYPENIERKTIEEEIKNISASLQKTDNQTNNQVQKIQDNLAVAKMKLKLIS